MLRPRVGDPLRFLSKKCENYYRWDRDTNYPHGVPEFVVVALPGTEKRLLLRQQARSQALQSI